METSTANTQTNSDDAIVAFQNWYNTTYGQPTIAVDGTLNGGTQEAYALHGNDFIKYLNVKYEKEKTDLANDLMAANDKVQKALKNEQSSNKKLYIGLGIGLFVGIIATIIIKK